MSDDLAAFLDDLQGPLAHESVPEVEEPLPAYASLDAHLEAFPVEGSCPLPPPEGLEEAVESILILEPRADVGYLREALSEAMRASYWPEMYGALVFHLGKYRRKGTGRIGYILSLFLIHGGVATYGQIAARYAATMAVNDVRVAGFRVLYDQGYRLDVSGFDPEMDRDSDHSKEYKASLRGPQHCNLCGILLEPEEVVPDHRVSLHIVGEALVETEGVHVAFQPLCTGCNIRKGIECRQNCPTGKVKDASLCGSCRLAYPEEGRHTHERGRVILRPWA